VARIRLLLSHCSTTNKIFFLAYNKQDIFFGFSANNALLPVPSLWLINNKIGYNDKNMQKSKSNQQNQKSLKITKDLL